MLEQLKKPQSGEEYARLKTNHGDILIRLFEEAAPKTVENFKKLIEKNYYDGIIFHRIIKDFMIQGGDPTGTGTGGESAFGTDFEDEFSLEFRNLRGALSMANRGPNTNGSQFFIVQGQNVSDDIISQMKEVGEKGGFPDEIIDAYKNLGGAFWLDGKHTVFGHVFEGMDIVDEIANVKTDFRDKPVDDVVILEAKIEKF